MIPRKTQFVLFESTNVCSSVSPHMHSCWPKHFLSDIEYFLSMDTWNVIQISYFTFYRCLTILPRHLKSTCRTLYTSFKVLYTLLPIHCCVSGLLVVSPGHRLLFCSTTFNYNLYFCFMQSFFY